MNRNIEYCHRQNFLIGRCLIDGFLCRITLRFLDDDDDDDDDDDVDVDDDDDDDDDT